ncbi:MAG: M1 family metallopeptidase [bacterium]|nr:M1 family metallopeptidase [bacterium]
MSSLPHEVRHRLGSRLLPLVLFAVVMPAVGGCATPLAMRAVHYDLRVRLDPSANHLSGDAAVRLERIDEGSRLGAAVVELELHPALTVVAVDCDTARVTRRGTRQVEDDEGDSPPFNIHTLVLHRAPHECTMTVHYEGKLFQDPSAGEQRGKIHNFTMSAHVGTNGVYLSDSGRWYPAPVLPEDGPPEHYLADFALAVESVPGMELAAGLERVLDGPADGVLRWISRRPLSGLVLTGGERTRYSADHRGIRLNALVSSGKEDVGEDVIACARQCVDRYVPLVGPYPYAEFSVLESFFSSGFAFPGFTQLAPVILTSKKPYWRHGYLDHEFLHNWFGNGVYVDPHDGNWCEALTSYCANLFGFELDNDPEGARRLRRNKCHFLSGLKPEKDKPLGTFGLDDAVSRSIGYDKGCMVFHMLAYTIGQDAFWAGIQQLTTEFMGRYANWDDLRTCFAAHTDYDLKPFFEQWVRGSGAPGLELLSAEYDPAAKALTLAITQGETTFTLDVPIRIYASETEFRDVVVTVSAAEEIVRLPVSDPPVCVELDPDYHMFRKVPIEQTLPTSRLTRYGKKVLIINPDGEVWENYGLVASDFEEGNGEGNATTISAAKLTADALADTGILILGSAVHHPEIQELLARSNCPITWLERGFRVDDKLYDQHGQAVFVTMRHPDCPKRGITVYCGNDERSLANAGILGYYSNSLLVFGTSAKPVEGMGMSGATTVLHRDDLEMRIRVPVVRR